MTVRSPAVAAVLLVGGRHPAAARAARRAGLRIHYLGARDGAPGWLEGEADEVTLLDTPDAESVTAAAWDIHATQPFDVAISMSDAYVEAVAVVNERLGLTANSPRTARTVNDKALMREVLRDSGVASVAAARVTTGEQARRFPAEAGYPFVLKPADGSGSRGVTLVPDEESLADAVAHTVGSGSGTWIAEEYLRGPEFSVETFSADGEHHLLAVTEKFKGANFVEVGHLVPARIAAETVRALADEAVACLDAVGLLEGPAHTELILTDKGPRVVETHARPGGDGIVELVRLAVGLDAQQLTFDWLAGRPLDLDGARHEIRAAATWFLTPHPGTVADVGGLREALTEEGVTEAYLAVAPGDVIGELRGSSDRAGAVIAAADTPDAALDRARLAAGRLQVGVTSETVPAS
ncbi:ATP-grasp domain-containing protein [Streptomyces sp. NBC_00151]|uniref:ATP-grasp domain-containing protein n=1 Tax=Streptomyces sp. NBC_00151 TaxID=2975669 RepID=UPI002DD83CF4|nr:ATP-grasp domain-containing protein [Streptomyces sp. NBC_00151]WRZ39762.1 ATP-grasp domain-containing protein [Streptomyces sp. NBC_00151]